MFLIVRVDELQLLRSPVYEFVAIAQPQLTGHGAFLQYNSTWVIYPMVENQSLVSLLPIMNLQSNIASRFASKETPR